MWCQAAGNNFLEIWINLRHFKNLKTDASKESSKAPNFLVSFIGYWHVCQSSQLLTCSPKILPIWLQLRWSTAPSWVHLKLHKKLNCLRHQCGSDLAVKKYFMWWDFYSCHLSLLFVCLSGFCKYIFSNWLEISSQLQFFEIQHHKFVLKDSMIYLITRAETCLPTSPCQRDILGGKINWLQICFEGKVSVFL